MLQLNLLLEGRDQTRNMFYFFVHVVALRGLQKNCSHGANCGKCLPTGNTAEAIPVNWWLTNALAVYFHKSCYPHKGHILLDV